MTNFNPNAQTSSVGHKTNYDWLWATYIPLRKPKFKIHGCRGLAVSAIRYRYNYDYDTKNYPLEKDVRLYRRESANGEWVEVPIKQALKESSETIFVKEPGFIYADSLKSIHKKCPFAVCNGTPILDTMEDGVLDNYYVECSGCFTTPPGLFKTPEEAWAAWDNRNVEEA